ncbi:MAG: DUF1858 domain-containing protein [Clostridia bacterium]|nr:DUF1858 domain-containing protein [Clostridia bacterium]
MREYINENTLIGEIVREYPQAAEVLFAIGMHCLGCPSAQGETLAQACAVHGVPAGAVALSINRKIAESIEA